MPIILSQSAGLSFGDLDTELAARGYDNIDQPRRFRMLNDAYQALCDMDQWPFLETTVTGTAPLTISDLRQTLYVVDTVTQTRLMAADSRDVVDVDPAVTTAGTPVMYWLDGLATLRTYPTNLVDPVSVRYLKVPVNLSQTSDSPIVPDRYRLLIVDIAEIEALKDRSNYADAQQVAQQFQPRLQRMRDSLMSRNEDDPDFIVVHGTAEGSWVW